MTKIMSRIVTYFGLVAALCFEPLDAQDVFQPVPIAECLNDPKAAGLEILSDVNPFYLRGDFDGDSKSDYALQVRSLSRGGTGVLICTGRSMVFLLGSGIGNSKFSDMEHDAFLAPQWDVFTKQDVLDLRKYRTNVPRPVPTVRFEAIAMIWEDGISLIYWDGREFKWAGSKH